MIGLLIGTFHLLVMLNACVRSIAGKWAIGSIAAVTRTFLLIAITMAAARIRVVGAQPTPGLMVAVYAGPAITFIVLALAFVRRRKTAAGSEAEGAAEKIVRAWLAAAIFDAIFVVVNVGARVVSSSP